MVYKIEYHQTGGNFTITRESGVARPITAYMDGQIEPNTAYAVVTRKEFPSGEGLDIRLLDMTAKKGVRAIFPCFDIQTANPKGLLVNLIDPSINLGKLNLGYKVPPAAPKIYKKIWTRGIAKLLDTLKGVQHEYCKEKFTKHTVWLTEMNNYVVYKIVKNELAKDMGYKER